jgi:uncharacterized protein (DUF1499 family)
MAEPKYSSPLDKLFAEEANGAYFVGDRGMSYAHIERLTLDKADLLSLLSHQVPKFGDAFWEWNNLAMLRSELELVGSILKLVPATLRESQTKCFASYEWRGELCNFLRTQDGSLTDLVCFMSHVRESSARPVVTDFIEWCLEVGIAKNPLEHFPPKCRGLREAFFSNLVRRIQKLDSQEKISPEIRASAFETGEMVFSAIWAVGAVTASQHFLRQGLKGSLELFLCDDLGLLLNERASVLRFIGNESGEKDIEVIRKTALELRTQLARVIGCGITTCLTDESKPSVEQELNILSRACVR